VAFKADTVPTQSFVNIDSMTHCQRIEQHVECHRGRRCLEGQTRGNYTVVKDTVTTWRACAERARDMKVAADCMHQRTANSNRYCYSVSWTLRSIHFSQSLSRHLTVSVTRYASLHSMHHDGNHSSGTASACACTECIAKQFGQQSNISTAATSEE